MSQLTEKMSVENAFTNVRNLARSVQGNAEFHEQVTLALAVVLEQLQENTKLRAEIAALRESAPDTQSTNGTGGDLYEEPQAVNVPLR